jgi:hypothetical protein
MWNKTARQLMQSTGNLSEARQKEADSKAYLLTASISEIN